MAKPKCNVDVWDLAYQELLVLAHAQDTQVVAQENCEDIFVTGATILDNNYKKYEIKK
tara:strand:- start:14816 stop:14989 length:174 start_codon:yes stop_codon:yes gene_type:complete